MQACWVHCKRSKEWAMEKLSESWQDDNVVVLSNENAGYKMLLFLYFLFSIVSQYRPPNLLPVPFSCHYDSFFSAKNYSALEGLSRHLSRKYGCWGRSSAHFSWCSSQHGSNHTEKWDKRFHWNVPSPDKLIITLYLFRFWDTRCRIIFI